jgi:hypothetical protein
MASEVFEAQVALLIRVLPHVATETCFALKGGTAINLFVRDLPRLSVDIDLVYLPIENRETSLIGIRSALSRIAQKVRRRKHKPAPPIFKLPISACMPNWPSTTSSYAAPTYKSNYWTTP